MRIRDWLHREPPAPPAKADDNSLESRVVAALRTIFDPEIPINIYDLGLIYALEIDEEKRDKEKRDVRIRMTLTAAACPVAQSFPGVVGDTVRALDGVGDVDVELVWEPPWSREMMNEAARLQLGML